MSESSTSTEKGWMLIIFGSIFSICLLLLYISLMNFLNGILPKSFTSVLFVLTLVPVIALFVSIYAGVKVLRTRTPDKLKGEINAAKNDLARLKEENGGLEDMKKKVEKSSEDSNVKEEKIKELDKRIYDNEMQQKVLESIVEIIKPLQKAYGEAIDDLLKNIEASEAKLEKTKADLEQAGIKCDDINIGLAKIQPLKEELIKAESELEATIKQIRNLDDIKNKVTAENIGNELKSRKEKLQNAVGNIGARLKNIKERVKAYMANIDNLLEKSNDVLQLKLNFMELETRLKKALEALKKVAQYARGQNQEIQGFEQQIIKLKQEINDLVATIRQKENEISNMKDLNDENIKQKEKELKESASRINGMQEQINDLKTKIALLTTRNS